MSGFHHYHRINRNRRVRLQDTGRFTSCTSDRNVWLYRGGHHFEAALNKPTRAKNIVRITRSWDFGAQRPGINIFKQKKFARYFTFGARTTTRGTSTPTETHRQSEVNRSRGFRVEPLNLLKLTCCFFFKELPCCRIADRIGGVRKKVLFPNF